MEKPTSKIAFYTLGCKLNQLESEAIASAFANSSKGAGDKIGVEIVSLSSAGSSISEKADIFIINTCTVTSKSEQKARRIIKKIAFENSSSLVIVTGCYAQLDSGVLEKLGNNVAVVSQNKKKILIDSAGEILAFYKKSRDGALGFSLPASELVGNIIEKKDYSEISNLFPEGDNYFFHSRAFLKIQDGCNNFCTYCRVPLARGKSVSFDTDKLLPNVQRIEEKGYREIVLTGVNISMYNYQDINLPSLVDKMLSETDKIRIRLSSIEPDSIEESWKELSMMERICPHFHIPVQSGSPNILKAMGRKYNPEKVFEAISILRSSQRNPLISADIITGFPGEKEKDFQDTVELIKKCSFAYLHVFPFSRRPGTAAYLMNNRVPERISGERAKMLRLLSEEMFEKYAALWLYKEVEALLENRDKEGHWNGLAGNYLKLRITDRALDSDKKQFNSGDIVKCLITKHRKKGSNSFDATFISSL